jgi:crossover junction endodeoxyribonuclease RuvC
MMAILGVDPSLTSTGICYEGLGEQIITGRIQPGKYLKDSARLSYIQASVESIMDMLFDYGDKENLIVYEGYSMGSGAKGRTFDMGELGGVLKTLAFNKGVAVLLVPPRNLKLFATGRGNAEKLDVVQAVNDTWDCSLVNNDEADAFTLYQMGKAYRSKKKVRAAHRVQALMSCRYVPGRVSK